MTKLAPQMESIESNKPIFSLSEFISPIERSKERSKEGGAILSKSHQIAQANTARNLDVQRRKEKFLSLFNPKQTDKLNKKKITKKMGISNRTFYNYKKEL